MSQRSSQSDNSEENKSAEPLTADAVTIDTSSHMDTSVGSQSPDPDTNSASIHLNISEGVQSPNDRVNDASSVMDPDADTSFTSEVKSEEPKRKHVRIKQEFGRRRTKRSGKWAKSNGRLQCTGEWQFPISVHMEFHRLWKSGVTWRRIRQVLRIPNTAVSELSRRYRLLDKMRNSYPFCQEIRDSIDRHLSEKGLVSAPTVRKLLLSDGVCTRRSIPTLSSLERYLTERRPAFLPFKTEEERDEETTKTKKQPLVIDAPVNSKSSVKVKTEPTESSTDNIGTRTKAKRKASKPSKVPPLKMAPPSPEPSPETAEDAHASGRCSSESLRLNSSTSATSVVPISPPLPSESSTAISSSSSGAPGPTQSAEAIVAQSRHPLLIVDSSGPTINPAAITPGSVHWLAIDSVTNGLEDATYLGIVYLGHNCWRPLVIPQGFSPAGPIGSSTYRSGTGIEASMASVVQSNVGPVLSIS